MKVKLLNKTIQVHWTG